MTRRLTIWAIIGALLFVPVFAMSQDPIKKPDVSKLRKQSTSSTTTSSSSPSKKPSTTTVSSSTGSISGHGYVDLGLSVKWARCNIGTSSPEGYGNYYAWGETSPKSSYDEGNSKTYGKSSYNHIGGDSSTDAARANWGGSWRLPTEEEFQELLDNCNWTWTTLNGKAGYKVVSKKTGNSIFVPAAGGRGGSSLYYAGESGYYWSSTPNEDDSSLAYDLRFSSRLPRRERLLPLLRAHCAPCLRIRA